MTLDAEGMAPGCPGSWRDVVSNWNDPGVQPEEQRGLGHAGGDNDGTGGAIGAKTVPWTVTSLQALCLLLSDLIITATPCERCGSRGTERLSNQSKVTRLVKGYGSNPGRPNS